MGIKIITWAPEQVKGEISRRYKNARDARRYMDDRWERSERTIYSNVASQNISFLDTTLESTYNIGIPGVDGSNADINVGYSFKNLRFLHSQLSANPPSVVMRPTSSDQDNRRKADAADRLVRYAIRHYNLQEMTDKTSLQTLLYGTGIMKTVWDSTQGEIIEVDEETSEVILEGDIRVSVPHIWNMYIDPDAQSEQEIKWMIEKLYIDYDEACSRWPDKKELLDKARIVGDVVPSDTGRQSQIRQAKYNTVELLEYWETGLPTNGYLGRYCITNTDGDVVELPRPNPHRFAKFGEVSRVMSNPGLSEDAKQVLIRRLPQVAQLPYHIFSDVDMPNKVWGKSFLDYLSNLQSHLNKLDSATLDNLQAHGVARLILPESAQIAEDSITNSPWDVVKITGAQPPFFMGAPGMMPDMGQMRQYLIQSIGDMAGTNEAMFGQQSREQSGASMQYATNQGNMVRRRLFNKYVLFVESTYRSILNLVRKHWDTSRTIHVLGKEKALEAVDIKGMDIDGGYDVVAEYGVSLSLDPMTRREEIMALQPLFEKAGIPTRVSLKMMKLNELEGMYDLLQLAEDRQREIFEEMIATGRYIPPEELQDHQNMIAYALQYFMTTEFKYLETPMKDLCKQHVKDRAALAAKEMSTMSAQTGLTNPAAGPQPPGPPPGTPPSAGPGAPPPAPGMTGQQATVAEGTPPANG